MRGRSSLPQIDALLYDRMARNKSPRHWRKQMFAEHDIEHGERMIIIGV